MKKKKADASGLCNHIPLYSAEFYYLILVDMIHAHVLNILK